ncbi:A24 family peptidase [Lachnospiraceae bacterium 62-35]
MEITAGIALAAAATAAERWQLQKKELWSKNLVWILGILNGAVFTAGLWLMPRYDYHILKTARYLILMAGLIQIGVIDSKTKTISNRFLAALFAIRAVLLPVEIMCFPSFWNMILSSSLTGLVGCTVMFLIAYFLSRGGIGMGDVKLLAVMGFYLGMQTTISCLIIMMLLTVFTGLGMIIAKKASLKTELPFGPFAAAGTIITLLMGF